MTSSEIHVWADGTANSEAYWSERNRRWVFVDFLNHGETTLVEAWVEVSLDLDAEPNFEIGKCVGPDGGEYDERGDLSAYGLDQATIACDLEGDGRWVVSLEDYCELAERYGDCLCPEVVGTHDGLVLASNGDVAEFLDSLAEAE